jgi:hypothetical protein
LDRGPEEVGVGVEDGGPLVEGPRGERLVEKRNELAGIGGPGRRCGEPLVLDLVALVAAENPTRDTESPTFTAGRTPELNRSVSRKICPSVIEITFVGM